MFEKLFLSFLKAWGGAIASGLLVFLQTDDWKAGAISALVAGGVVAGVPNDLSRASKTVKEQVDLTSLVGEDSPVNSDDNPVEALDGVLDITLDEI